MVITEKKEQMMMIETPWVLPMKLLLGYRRIPKTFWPHGDNSWNKYCSIDPCEISRYRFCFLIRFKANASALTKQSLLNYH